MLYTIASTCHKGCMIHTSPTLVIGGSVRAQRLCIQIAEWVSDLGRESSGGVFEVVDLRKWRLPMDDEPDIPATGRYAKGHTRAWSRKVGEAGAIIFVTPQYNWGYPAALKNALDHLYKEWAGKPAMIVTYGGHGGGKCAEQLRQVLDGLHMQTMATMPGLVLPRDRVEANTGRVNAAEEFAAHLPDLRQALSELAAARAPA
jgi:NAD(P)H-dependent FMN reductase